MNLLKHLLFVVAFTSTTLLDNCVSAFVRTNYNGYTNAYQKRTAVTSQKMVFERMSEDCIGAIVIAQREAQKCAQTQLEAPFLVAGIIDMPESPALERTFKQYGITWRKTTQALQVMYSSEEKTDGLGKFFKPRNPDDDLPFSRDVQKVLKSAGNMADQMGSKSIQSQHLFLAMMEYKAGKPSTAVTDNVSNGAYALITKMDPNLKAIDMCESLLDHLKENEEKEERDLVTGIGEGAGTKTLDECGIDLTAQARDGLLDVVQGRDKEIQACIRTLVRRRKNNVCLIGEPGVGKTAIAEGIAQVLISPECPARLKGTRLMSLELSTLVAGTKYRGEFEERLQAIIAEVTDPKAPPTMLFIDEIHNLVGAGAAEGGMDAANLLKPALARGQLQVIGATTISEYRKHIEKDAALERRFQPCMIKEPSVLETIEILRAIAQAYEEHHKVKYTPESLVAAAKLSERYLVDRFLPDKVCMTQSLRLLDVPSDSCTNITISSIFQAIDLLDEAGAIAHLNEYSEGIDGEDDHIPVVDENTVAMVISEWASIPLGKLESDEMERLLELEEDMASRVKGQKRAIQAVSRAVRRARSGLRDPNRPIASFMFCGPTGTGEFFQCESVHHRCCQLLIALPSFFRENRALQDFG
jgi:ATP-dependent Clp protease ATP-binding subunit ClpC